MNGWWQNSVNCDLTVSVPSTIVCSDNSTVTLQSTVGGTNPLPPFTYQWATSTNANISTSANITVSASTTTTYSVTVHDANNAYTSSTATIEVIDKDFCCIPPTYNNLTDYSFSNKNVAAVISQYSAINNYRISTSNIILINGVFTVDHNFTFDGCHHIILGPGALIDVKPGVQLTLFDCIITPCYQMAKGILARVNSTIDMQGTFISGCEFAIEAQHHSTLKISGDYFWDNYVGIYFVPSGQTASTSIYASIAATEFAKISILAPPYKNQLTLPLDHPFAGILMENISILNLGILNTPENKFIEQP